MGMEAVAEAGVWELGKADSNQRLEPGSPTAEEVLIISRRR
jgi:hypothetical protein